MLARYARAIAYYRIPDLAKALPTIDGLIHDFPNNPYYRELKGQMLFENGRIREAIAPYEAAVRLAPAAPLLRIALSQAYIETGDPALEQAGDRLSRRCQPQGRARQRGLALPRRRLRARQPDGHGGLVAGRGGARRRQEKGLRMQQSDRAKQLLARNTAGYARAEEIHREAKQDDD